jgi:hypothetical protein
MKAMRPEKVLAAIKSILRADTDSSSHVELEGNFKAQCEIYRPNNNQEAIYMAKGVERISDMSYPKNIIRMLTQNDKFGRLFEV